MNELILEPVTITNQSEARNVILAGLKERFGSLDCSFNTDLNNIVQHYLQAGDTFLIGRVQNMVVCTGSLVYDADITARIVRMSVLQEYRRRGFARRMLMELEKVAKSKGFTRIVLETTNTWNDAIAFYMANGYTVFDLDEIEIHMEKNLL